MYDFFFESMIKNWVKILVDFYFKCVFIDRIKLNLDIFFSWYLIFIGYYFLDIWMIYIKNRKKY